MHLLYFPGTHYIRFFHFLYCQPPFPFINCFTVAGPLRAHGTLLEAGPGCAHQLAPRVGGPGEPRAAVPLGPERASWRSLRGVVRRRGNE